MEACSRIFHLIVFCYLLQVAIEEPLAADGENNLQVQASASVSAQRYNLSDRSVVVCRLEVCIHSPPQCSKF